MPSNLLEASPAHAPSLDDLGNRIVAMAQDLLKAACADEDELYHFFQAIAYHVEENGADLSASELTEMLRSEMAILAAGGVEEDSDPHWDELPSKYKTDTPEESHVLEMLLRHRIHVSGVDDLNTDDYYDPDARKPKAEKILDILDTKLEGDIGAAEQLDLLHKYAPQFCELAEFYESVARKHGICWVRSEQDWLADKEVEDLLDIKETPVDLSAALERYSTAYKIKSLVWEAQTSGTPELGAQLRAFIDAVPDIFFREARETFSELESSIEQRAAFEAWLLERASNGIFRTDVMAEIERLWSSREIAKRAGRNTLERLETQGLVVRKKHQGKLFFIRAV